MGDVRIGSFGRSDCPGHSSFNPSTVAPGGQVTVTIVAADYGSLGGITETLPAGFTFVSSADGSAIANAADGRERVRFILLSPPQTVFLRGHGFQHRWCPYLRGDPEG